VAVGSLVKIILRIFLLILKHVWKLINIWSYKGLLLSSLTPWARSPVGVDCMSSNPLPLNPVGCLPSQVCAGPPCTNPWYHPSILDMVSLSVPCHPSHQTLWLLTFVRPLCGKCGQRIGVFSVSWSEIRFCWLQCASSLLHSWLSVATGCAKSTCNTSF